MRIIFDLDDTISIHRNRDYANAAPIQATVDKMRKLKKDGCEIYIYSARGQNSCHGDLELIEQRNRAQIENWLKTHDVPCDKLIFGKPLGDLYVDDKGVSLDDFLDGDYERLKGNSGAEVYRAGKRVIKKCKDARQQADWYEQAKAIGITTPKVISVVLDTISIEYIDGTSGGAKSLTGAELYRVISAIMLMSAKKAGYTFDADALIRRANRHLEATGNGGKFSKLFDYINSRKDKYAAAASFCHGDLSLSNTIFSGGKIYLIDPSVNDEYSSYLLDFAKLLFSLDGGERFLHGKAQYMTPLLREYTQMLSENGILTMVRALEAVYWIRLLMYTDGRERRTEIIAKAEEIEQQL